MTRAERVKLAKAARELAMECVAGTAPEFGDTYEFEKDGSPRCIVGHVVARAGLAPGDGRPYAFDDLAGDIISARRVVTDANDSECVGDSDALPWALLNLADELESQP